MSANLDRIDFEILGLLQKNILLPYKAIAAQVGLASSSVHDRIKRLWSSGVLRSASAEIDLKSLGFNIEALLMIELSQHDRSTVENFMKVVLELPEVQFAYLVTGRHDMIVKIVVRDMEHLKDLALDHFTSRPNVTRIETCIVFEARNSHINLSTGHRIS